MNTKNFLKFLLLIISINYIIINCENTQKITFTKVPKKYDSYLSKYEKDEDYENSFYKENQKKEEKKNNFGVAANMRIIYKNYSKIELGLSDLIKINKKEIINNLQVISIWEYLMNKKTKRNTNIFNENKILFFDEEKNPNKKNENLNNKNENSFFILMQNFSEFFFKILGYDYIDENTDLNFYQFLTFFQINFSEINTIYDINFSNFFPNFTKENFNKLLIFLNFHKIYFIIFIGLTALVLFHFIKFYSQKNIKLVIFVLILTLLGNISLTFLFFGKSFFAFSLIFYLLFLSNIYFLLISLVILSGKKEDDYSIFQINFNKTEKVLFIKILMVFILFSTNEYYTLFYLKKLTFFLIHIFFMEMLRRFFINFQKDNTNLPDFQPWENFVSSIFGFFNYIFCIMIYNLNLKRSYEYNTFLFINQIYSFYLITNFDKCLFAYLNNIGEGYLQLQQKSSISKNLNFNNLSQKALKLPLSNLYDYHKANRSSIRNLNFFFQILILTLITFQFFYDSLFSLFLAIYIFSIYIKNYFRFFELRNIRILKNFFLAVFSLCILLIKFQNFNTINYIVAINDERFIQAIKLLTKLIFTIFLFKVIFLEKNFFDFLNIYKYTSYKYIEEEGFNSPNENEEEQNKIFEESKIKNSEKNKTSVYDNYVSNNNEYNSTNFKNINIDIDLNKNFFNANGHKKFEQKNKKKVGENVEKRNLYKEKSAEIYNIANSLDEIINFDIDKSVGYVNVILDALNFDGKNLNIKIDSLYIEHLLINSQKKSNFVIMLIDYFFCYGNIWLMNYTLKEETKTTILFFLLLQGFKICLFFKFFVIIFEYSKTKIQIFFLIFINLFTLNRLLSFYESNLSDVCVTLLLINLNKFVYLYFLENNNLMNLLILAVSIIEFRRNNEIILLGFLISCVFLKIFFLKFPKFSYKKLAFLLINCGSLSLIYLHIKENDLNFYYENFQKIILDNTGFDLIGTFEYLCFSSTTSSTKNFGESASEIFIENSKFFEEEFIKNILKNIIKFRLVLFDSYQ